MSVKNRIKLVAKHYEIPISNLENRIGASNGYVNSISKSIGLDKMNNFIKSFPDVNLLWLINGDGNMINTYKSDLNTIIDNDLNIPQLLEYLLDNNEHLIKDENFRKYILMNKEHISLEKDKEDNSKALEKLKQKVKEKYTKKKN